MKNRTLENAMQAEGAAGKAFARQHGGFYRDEQVLSLIFQPIRMYVRQLHSETLRVADIGCGSGIVGSYVGKQLETMGYRVQLVFIDSNKAMLNAIKPSANKELVLADISALPRTVLHHPVDIVVGRQFIQYIPPATQKTILEQMHQYLKQEGLFVNATGSHEKEKVMRCMTYYLDAILKLRNPKNPAKRYYQTTQTYLSWMRHVGFSQVRVVGKYAQPCWSSDYYERYGFDKTEMTPTQVEQRVNSILERLDPDTEIQKALRITREQEHHTIHIPGRIFVGQKS